MAWVYLTVAGLLEIVFAYGLKTAAGMTRLWPSVLTIIAAAASLYLLSRALRTIPIGTGYAVWTGIGAAGTALVGMLWLGEARSAARLACIALILIGVVGLRVFAAD
ncbi:MAG TPA: multidrug efflux SMR transporter [Gemmatimonadaceae bacterium]|nr:multidrug efflux SMR transporter [Gemmatimonadaceae bacterium]